MLKNVSQVQRPMQLLALLAAATLSACGGSSQTGGTLAVAGSTPAPVVPVTVPEAAAPPQPDGATGGEAVPAAPAACPAITLAATDAQTLTGDTTPLQMNNYGVRTYSAPVLVDGAHDPANYLAAPRLPTWQFATQDPTNGVLGALECDPAPTLGWHAYARNSGTSANISHKAVTVTGGRNATADHVYTVYNGQQLVAALKAAGLAPKIVRVVGHIDLRMSANNSVFREYTSYADQKLGGSISVPSNTTLVGINDAQGRPARITGTAVLIGGELGLTTAQLAGANGDPEHDFKAWIAAGKDGELYPTWTRNVIVRNLKIDTPWDVNPEDAGNAYADGMTVSRAQNVWLDHLSMTDGDTPDTLTAGLASPTRHDGNLDIVRGSDYVTVSHSFFGDHAKNTLVGNGDSGRAWSDAGRLHVTFHRLWWSGIGSRLPLVRYAQLHTLNNLMQGWTGSAAAYGHSQGSGLDVRWQASVFAENNFHLFSGLKPGQVCGKLVSGKDALAYRITGAKLVSDKDDDGKPWAGAYGGPLDVTAALTAAGCAKSTLPAADIGWTPPYAYAALDAAEASTQVQIHSGAGRIGAFAVLGSAGAGADSGTGTTPDVPATGGGLSASWASDFSAATTASLLTAAAYPLPTDATLPLYYQIGSNKVTAGAGTLTLAKSAILMIGATANSATTASGAPPGVFDIVGKACTLVLDAASAGLASDTGNLTVGVDNNTSSSSNSPHGKAGTVVTVASKNIVAGENRWSWTLNDAAWPAGSGSSLSLRIDTGVPNGLQIRRLSLDCI